MSPHNPSISQHVRPQVIDAPVTLNSRTYQWCCCNNFRVEGWLIVRSWFIVATQPLHFQWYKAKCYWHSGDAHVSDTVPMLSQRCVASNGGWLFDYKLRLERNPPHFQWCNAKNCWHCVYAHFYELVAISSVAIVPIKAANIMIMAKCYGKAEWLSRL
jgi:hypothetical protein